MLQDNTLTEISIQTIIFSSNLKQTSNQYKLQAIEFILLSWHITAQYCAGTDISLLLTLGRERCKEGKGTANRSINHKTTSPS